MAQTTENPKLTSSFEQALIYATKLHVKQVIKCSDIPYISHLVSVGALILEDGGDREKASAGLLQDAVKYRGGKETREAILRQFGERVVSIVDGCTEPYLEHKPPGCTRKLQYIEQMRYASSSVQRVAWQISCIMLVQC